MQMTKTCVLTAQAQTNITIAEAEAADENAKHWLRMQNTKRAGGISSDYCIMFLDALASLGSMLESE